MQSHKTGHRSDARNRTSHRPAQDQTYPKIVDPKIRKVGAVQAAARVTNLKLLLSRVEGDLVMLAAAVQLDLTALKQRLDGFEVVEDGSAMYIEETLALDPGWLDGKHFISDISPKTVDILYGRGISESEEEIRQSEQKGHEIMKNAIASANAASANRVPPPSRVEKPSEELIQLRIANLTLLTQARGAKSRLARLLKVSESIVSFLFNRNKEFTHHFTRELETALGLPANWFDSAQEIQTVPQTTWDILGSAAKSAPLPPKPAKAPKTAVSSGLTLSMKTAPTELERASQSSTASNDAASVGQAVDETQRGHRVHRLGSTKARGPAELTLQLSTSTAPSVLVSTPGTPETLPELNDDDVAGPPAAVLEQQIAHNVPAAPAAAGTPAPVVSTRMRRVPAQPAPSAGRPAPILALKQDVQPAAAPPQPAVAPAVQPAASVVQAQANPAVEPAIAASIQSRPDTLLSDNFVLHPITEALIKTLTLKEREGKFKMEDALRLLNEIAVL